MNLLITGAWSDAKLHIAELEAMGNKVVFMQQEKEELPCDGAWVEGVICNGLFLSHPFSEFPNLRYIQLTSAGYDRVDMAEVERRGIEIHNAKGVYSIPMAEFAVGGVLALYKKLRLFAEKQKQHKWEKQRDLLELYGKTVCIVGCGDVGQECAKRFAAFGCEIVEVHRDLRNLDEWKAADIVVVTIALTEQTRKLIKPTQMKKGSVLVNISRGAVVDEADLVKALDGQLLGAVLDVFEEEPLALDSPLWDMENVIVTPHNSFVGDGDGERMRDRIRNNLEIKNEYA